MKFALTLCALLLSSQAFAKNELLKWTCQSESHAVKIYTDGPAESSFDAVVEVLHQEGANEKFADLKLGSEKEASGMRNVAYSDAQGSSGHRRFKLTVHPSFKPIYVETPGPAHYVYSYHSTLLYDGGEAILLRCTTDLR